MLFAATGDSVVFTSRGDVMFGASVGLEAVELGGAAVVLRVGTFVGGEGVAAVVLVVAFEGAAVVFEAAGLAVVGTGYASGAFVVVPL